MADRTCEKCGKEFSKPYWLKVHRGRKTPCDLILDKPGPPPKDVNRCRFCGRDFASYQSMCRHIRTTCRIAPNQRNGQEGMDYLYEHVKRQQSQLQEQKERLEKQEAKLAVLQNVVAPVGGEPGVRVTGQNNSVTINQLQQNNQMNVVVFGQESTAHLTPGAIKRLLDEAVGLDAGPAAALAMLRAAEEIYSNRSHPENITCFLPNKKTKEALVHGAAGWEVRPEAAVLPAIAQRSHTALFNAQPLPELEGCEDMRSHRDYLAIYKELQANEKLYNSGVLGLRELLVRNKALLEAALGTLPRANEANTPREEAPTPP